MSVITKGFGTSSGRGGRIITKGYGALLTTPFNIIPDLTSISVVDENLVRASLVNTGIAGGGGVSGPPEPVSAPTPTRPLWFVINWLFRGWSWLLS